MGHEKLTATNIGMCLWRKRQVLTVEMVSQKFGKRDYFYVQVATSMFFVISTHILFILSNPQFPMVFSRQRTFLLILKANLLVSPDQGESQGVWESSGSWYLALGITCRQLLFSMRLNHGSHL